MSFTEYAEMHTVSGRVKRMITRSAFSISLSNYVTESVNKRYRHHLIKVYANKRRDFIEELTIYVQKAHEDAKPYLRKVTEISLDPLGEPSKHNIADGYPERLHMQTLKGYLGEVFAGLVAEYCSPFGVNSWKVPAFLFRFHDVAFQHLEFIRQTGSQAHPIPGRTGDDCLAFQLDNQGQIVRSLYCEAKCTPTHHTNMVIEAHEKVSTAEIVDVPQLIRILQDSSDPDAAQWVDALRQLRLRLPVPDDERYDLVSYVCSPPKRRNNWARLPTDKPHPQYTASRRLEAVEIHLPDVESVIREVYGITNSAEALDTDEYVDEDAI
jgi:hypothetical protein